MTARKPKLEFPKECCGVCSYSTVAEKREGDDLVCWVDAPQSASETDENGTIIAVWMRGSYVAPQMPACRHFKGRCHA